MCRELIYLVSFVLVIGLVLTSGASAADPDLLGWWKLDGDPTDSSGNGHDGVLFGNPQWVAGQIGGALEFDGVDDRVEMPDTNKAAGFAFTGEVTWAAWFKTPGGSEMNTIMAQDPPGAAHVRGNISLNVETSGVLRLRSNGVGNLNGHNSNVAVNDDQWHHVAVTIAFETNGAKDTMKLYIDGDLSKGYEIDVIDINVNRADATDFIIVLGYNGGRAFGGPIDDVRIYSRVLTEAEIQEVMKGISPGLASNPSPAHEATDVPRDVILSWTPGEFAPPTNGHIVYFSESFNDVNDSIGGITQDASSYSPPQRLDLGKTYYWRVDEVNGPPDFTVHQGDVWRFTTEPFAYPINGNNITATASSSNKADEGSENTINGSGLDADDLHSLENHDMWLSSMTGAQPTWIQYEFDRIHKLHQMWVWNHNTAFESILGFGLKDVSIEYSTDGADWKTLGGVPEFAQAPGADGYAHNTTVDFGGTTAKYVRLMVNSNWGGFLNQYGLSEVRFFYIPVWAREPDPASGVTDIEVDNVTLHWRTGREAAQHDVYLGTDEQAVIDGTAPVTTVSQASYGPLSLDIGQTYYWRVDEVNEAETPAAWQGDIWNFGTQEYFALDDFEDYNDYPPDEIFSTWTDGWGTQTNGALIAHDQAPWAETTIVHGGRQSMSYRYDNNLKYSEAQRALSPPQDWTRNGIGALSLWFHGNPNNAVEQMYVKVNGSKVVYAGDVADIQQASWQQWNINLVLFGVDLANVTNLAIGFGDETHLTTGDSGAVYFDDIRLYPLREPESDLTGN